jgi:hypothetical protein
MGKWNVLALSATALALWMVAGAAQATVVYNWHPVSDDPDISVVGGSLEISDAAYRAGHVDYAYDHDYGSPGAAGSPIAQLAIVGGQQGSAGTLGVSVKPGDANDWTASLSFVFGAYLSGTLDVNNSESNYTMQSANPLAPGAPLWTLSQFNSDFPLGNGACFSGTCAGATGYWVLDASTIPVPEPSPRFWFALAAAALLGYAARRRRAAPQT